MTERESKQDIETGRQSEIEKQKIESKTERQTETNKERDREREKGTKAHTLSVS